MYICAVDNSIVSQKSVFYTDRIDSALLLNKLSHVTQILNGARGH